MTAPDPGPVTVTPPGGAQEHNVCHDDTDATAVAPMSEAEAILATSKIKGHMRDAWALLVEVHDRRGYVAMGYQTFESYVGTEFNISRSRGYQIINHGRVVQQLTAAAGVSTSVHITETEARDLKRQLLTLVPAVVEAVEGVDVEQRGPVVRAVIAEARRSVQVRRKPEEAPVVIDRPRHRKIDPDYVVSQTVLALDALPVGFDYIDIADVDPNHIPAWTASMKASLRTIRGIVRKLDDVADAAVAAADDEVIAGADQ